MAEIIAKILEVCIDAQVGLLVRAEDPNGTNQYIYRDATGIRWDEQLGGFRAGDPTQWDHRSLLETILRAAHRELGIRLSSTDSTIWHDDTANLSTVLISNGN